MKRKVLDPDAMPELGSRRVLTEAEWYALGFRNGARIVGVLGLLAGFVLGLLAAMAGVP